MQFAQRVGMAASTPGVAHADSWRFFDNGASPYIHLSLILLSHHKHLQTESFCSLVISRTLDIIHMATLSPVFGMTAANIERRLSEFIPQRRELVCYMGSIVILMFIFMNSHIFSPNFPIWMFVGLLFLIGIMKWYASFEQNPQRPQPQARTAHDDVLMQQVHMPTFVTRGQLPDIRIQLAELDRELDDSDYDALRALDEDIVSNSFGMSEDDINALLIYKYQAQPHPHTQKADDEENELSCTICMEQVNEGELIRRFPCSHEFHASCIFPWLQQQGTCPICKRRAG